MVRGIASLGWNRLKKCSEWHRLRAFWDRGHRAKMARQGKKWALPLDPDCCARQRHRLRKSRFDRAAAEWPKSKMRAARRTSGERDSHARTCKRPSSFPSRERIDSAFVGTLAHFLFPPSPATEWQSVRIVFVIFAAFICPLIAQLTLCRRGRRIVIIPARSTMLRSTVGRFASGGKRNQSAAPEKAAEQGSHGGLFSLLSPVRIPGPRRCRRRLRIFRSFDLSGRHPKRRPLFPPFEFSGGAESLDRSASELTGHRRLRSR